MKVKTTIFMVLCLFAHTATAQNIIMDTTTQMLTQQIASAGVDNTPTRRSAAPTAPATLYRERVPGKPEEGFVPITAAPKSNYIQSHVYSNGSRVFMLDDTVKKIKCFSYRSDNISCVKY